MKVLRESSSRVFSFRRCSRVGVSVRRFACSAQVYSSFVLMHAERNIHISRVTFFFRVSS